jgi:hypothetical protein
MLPAIQAAYFAEWRIYDGLQRVSLTISPKSSLDMGWLDLSPMMNDFTLVRYERLRHVQTMTLSFAVL